MLLSFDGGKYGSGAVGIDSADVKPLELTLGSDATTLQVRHPKDATPTRNAWESEFLQCFDRKVHVIPSPADGDQSIQTTSSEAREIGHTVAA